VRLVQWKDSHTKKQKSKGNEFPAPQAPFTVSLALCAVVRFLCCFVSLCETIFFSGGVARYGRSCAISSAPWHNYVLEHKLAGRIDAPDS
jgi:hypothetical protein